MRNGWMAAGLLLVVSAGGACARPGDGAPERDDRDGRWQEALEEDLAAIERLAAEGFADGPVPAHPSHPFEEIREHMQEVLGHMAKHLAGQDGPEAREKAMHLGWKMIDVDVRFAVASMLAHQGHMGEAVGELRGIVQEPEPQPIRYLREVEERIARARRRLARTSGALARAQSAREFAEQGHAELTSLDRRPKDYEERLRASQQGMIRTAGAAATSRVEHHFAEQELEELTGLRNHLRESMHGHEGHVDGERGRRDREQR
ncbi:MAG: hypothetical protein HY608_02205 [Planctomycetes bacterium]|nr:hypothetical protein [Planctomycetota bacterium]